MTHHFNIIKDSDNANTTNNFECFRQFKATHTALKAYGRNSQTSFMNRRKLGYNFDAIQNIVQDGQHMVKTNG